MNYRHNIGHDGSPVQQSMMLDRADYRSMNLDRLMLGVILSVHPADETNQNRSADQSEERRGHIHEATVLVVNDGHSTYMTLQNVLITPNTTSGLDDYEERLPRGSSCLTTGEDMNSSLHLIDPYDLDGDWCVVGFLGSQLDQPFILRYWPHARNPFDPATSGQGNPDSGGTGQALKQQRRYFRRINGVETVITSKGDVVLSTTFAGASLLPGEAATRGRFPRAVNEQGGSIRVYMKPESTLEWTWNPQEDGIGVQDQPDVELPQPNPPEGTPSSEQSRDNAYLQVSKDEFELIVPTSVRVTSSDTIRFAATNSFDIISEEDAVVITAATKGQVLAPTVELADDGATEALVLGTTYRQQETIKHTGMQAQFAIAGAALTAAGADPVLLALAPVAAAGLTTAGTALTTLGLPAGPIGQFELPATALQYLSQKTKTG